MLRWNVNHILIFGLSAGLASGVAGAFGGDVTLGYDDNLNNAPDDAVQIDSAFASLQARHLWSPWTEPRAGVDVGLAGKWYEVGEVSDLSWFSASALASAWTALGCGLFAPTLTLQTQLGWREYRSRARDGMFRRVNLTFGQRLTTRITAQIQAGWSQREARNAYYEGDQVSYGAAIQWTPVRSLQLFVRHDWHSGDLTVSVPQSDTRFEDTGLTSYMDDAFDGFNSYRLDTDGQVTRLGVSWLPNWAWSLNLSVSQTSTDPAKYPAPVGASAMYVYAGEYERTQSSLSLGYRF